MKVLRLDVSERILAAATVEAAEVMKRETNAFKGLDDGYKKLIITMDTSPFVNLENGYKRLNAFDFLLDENSIKP